MPQNSAIALAHSDTIVALITGASPAAVATVRVSGPDAWAVASQVFHPWPDEPTPRLALYGKFAHGDDGLALPFTEGHSYTGEQAVELSCHGSPASVRLLLERCVMAGARIARPGEFTERAFLNGRLDLTQAEAVRDTVGSHSEAQLRIANLQREGSLRRDVEAILQECRSILGLVEATVDFSEEIGQLDPDDLHARLKATWRRFIPLTLAYERTRPLRNGVRIALVGLPNAGKSSLLNRVLGFDRSIVTEIPGTTRDSIEEMIDLKGMPCVFIDTAGLRETEDRVEQLGVQRTYHSVETADQIWYVYDVARGWTAADEKLYNELPLTQLAVANKVDAGDNGGPGVRVSALTGQGLEELIQTAAARFPDVTSASYSLNPRQYTHLVLAQAHIIGALHTIESRLPLDLVSVELQAAIRELGKITGETASPDMLDEIFRDFCIGK